VRLILVVALTVTAVGSVPVAEAGGRRPTPLVALLDTGVRASHQEFDYAGHQMVGWWDFTADRKGSVVLPRRGQVWDTAVPIPYDNNGHGTGTAAMAVGRNRTPDKTPSAAPGFRFAEGKMLSDTGSGQARLGDGVRWAVRTLHADVISISIGTVAPVPAAVVADDLDALDEARAAGVLVVVANGNGWGNVGVVPGEPGWATGYSFSPSVLAVGSADTQGILETTDPEVTRNENVHTAANTGNGDYTNHGGTSFAAPFIAGFAARLIESARIHGRDASPGQIERLIKYSAVDTVRPPQSEGYGDVELAQLPAALVRAGSGTLPGRPTPDNNAFYVETVAGNLRQLWTSRNLRHPTS
jgi:hypothetical protein